MRFVTIGACFFWILIRVSCTMLMTDPLSSFPLRGCPWYRFQCGSNKTIVLLSSLFLDRRILRRLWIQFSGFVIEKRTTRKMVNWVCSLVGRIFYFSFFSGSYLLVNPNRTCMIEMGWHVNTNKGPRRLTTAHGDVSRRNFKNIQILKQYFKTTSCF
jgi:hypothetical protein